LRCLNKRKNQSPVSLPPVANVNTRGNQVRENILQKMTADLTKHNVKANQTRRRRYSTDCQSLNRWTSGLFRGSNTNLIRPPPVWNIKRRELIAHAQRFLRPALLNCVNLDVELRKLECWILQTTKLNRETNNVKSTIGVEKLETWMCNGRCRYKL